MKLEHGKTYKNRRGHSVTVALRPEEHQSVYPFVGLNNGMTYMNDGGYSATSGDPEEDLIAEIIKPVTVPYEDLVKQYLSQAQSAQTWIDSWNKSHDGAAAKNALYAIGKSSGIFMVLGNTGHLPMPTEVLAVSEAHSLVFDEIMSTYFKRGDPQ